MKQKIVAFTGAGISAESGLKTFRDNGGLWEGHKVEDVATPRGWARNPELVLHFYNERRRALSRAQPNAAHLGLAELEKDFEVTVITQNVDDLHERAGSTRVLHLHGELTKARSSINDNYVIEIAYNDIQLGDCCPLGAQLRPHIVWFEEAVPKMEEAIHEAAQARIFIVVGTSLVVYPAAGLLDFVAPGAPIYVINPERPQTRLRPNMHLLVENATTGVAKVVTMLRTG